MKLGVMIKNNKLLTLVAIAYIGLFITMPDKALLAVNNSLYYVLEMLMIMPVVFILTSIIEAWVPKEAIINSFGEKSGIKGNIFAFLLGSFSAGPIYAAFPVCRMLLKKGAGVANIIIVLSTWAVIKVPMLANEAKFLGVKFMAIRWVLTTISIFIMANAIARLVKKEDMPQEEEASDLDIRINRDYCMGCGLCVNILPDVFSMKDKKAILKSVSMDEETLAAIAKASKKCPAKAICIKDIA